MTTLRRLRPGLTWGAIALVLHVSGWLSPLLGLRVPLLHPESIRPLLWIASVAALQVALWSAWPHFERSR